MKILIFSLLFGLGCHPKRFPPLCMPRVTQDTDNDNQDEDHFVAVPASKVYGQAQRYKGGGGGRGGGSRGSGGGSRGSGTSSYGSGSCSLQCMRQMKAAIENDPEFSAFIEKQSKPFRFENEFDAKMLNKYCQKMNETLDCIAPCTDGQVRDVANKALALPRYMCVETRLTTYAPCYNKVVKKMEKVCHAENKCGPKKAALERNFNQRPSSMADIEEMLGNTCDYMICYGDCDRQKIIQECGADANRVLEGLYKKSIVVMEDMFTALGIQLELPQQCRRVGSGSDDEGTTDIDDDGDEDESMGGHGSNRGGGGESQSGRGNQGGGRGQGGRGQGQGGRGQGQGGRGQGGRGGGSGSGRGTGTHGGQRTTTQSPDDNEYIDEDK